MKLIPESYYDSALSTAEKMPKPCVELLHYQTLQVIKQIAIKAKKKASKHGSIPGVDSM